MKLVLYTRRNVGMYCLSHLVALGHEVSVISDDPNVRWLAERYGCKVCNFETIGDFDVFYCIHGNRIIPEKYLEKGVFINQHPCLYKFKGANPIKRYVLGADTEASVESHYMVKEVDAGEVIHSEHFETPICKTYADFYNVALPYYIKCLDETLNRFIG